MQPKINACDNGGDPVFPLQLYAVKLIALRAVHTEHTHMGDACREKVRLTTIRPRTTECLQKRLSVRV